MENKELIHETEDGLKVYLGCETDDIDADLSHYGEFTSNVGSNRFYFDRETGEVRDSETVKTVKDEYGDETETELVVADVSTRGCERGSYEYIAGFELGWELDDNSKGTRKTFAEYVKNGNFRKFGINPKRSKGRRSGYWMAVYCMAFDAKRMEDFINGYWWMEFKSVEVRDEDGNVLSQDGIGSIESDDTYDVMKEHFNLECLLREARIARGNASEILKANGQLELTF